MSKRKVGLIITLIDFLIIFLFIFYSNKYFTNSKTIKLNNIILKYKYFELKNNIGYMFNFSIRNLTEKVVPVKLKNYGIATFYIRFKNKKIWVKKSKFNKKFIKIKNTIKDEINILLKKDDVIMYNEVYDNYKNKFLDKGEYYFGVELNINDKNYVLEKDITIE